MTRHPKHRSRAKLLRSLYIWHRYLGLAAAVFVIVLALTGLALNHTRELGLDASRVRSDLLLDWYGVRAPARLISFRAGSHRITAAGNHVYWDARRLEGVAPPLLGALEFGDMVVVAMQDQVLLFTPEGDLIERLDDAAGIPAGLQAVGLSGNGELVIRAARGDYRTDHNFLGWKSTKRADAHWVQAEDPPAELGRAIMADYRGSDLTLERVVLDLHSGRILGSWGVYLVDSAAALFLLLAGSGVWLWSRRRASNRSHRQKRS